MIDIVLYPWMGIAIIILVLLLTIGIMCYTVPSALPIVISAVVIITLAAVLAWFWLEITNPASNLYFLNITVAP